MEKDNKKKPRTMGINFNIEKDTKIEIGSYNIEISGIGKEGTNSTDISTYIERIGKKNKIITQYNSKNKNVAVNPESLISEYDMIFVADTNTKDIDENIKRCIGIIGFVAYNSITSEYELKEGFHVIYDINKNDNNHEKYTWNMLVNIILGLKGYSEDMKIGIVVDAYLQDLKDYNQGKEILEGFILPPNFKFIYASADKSGDNFFTKAIRECDKAANALKSKV